MKFYTSVLPYRGRLLVRGVDANGDHKKYRINYKPSLFVPVGKETKYVCASAETVDQVMTGTEARAERKRTKLYQTWRANMLAEAIFL